MADGVFSGTTRLQITFYFKCVFYLSNYYIFILFVLPCEKDIEKLLIQCQNAKHINTYQKERMQQFLELILPDGFYFKTQFSIPFYISLPKYNLELKASLLLRFLPLLLSILRERGFQDKSSVIFQNNIGQVMQRCFITCILQRKEDHLISFLQKNL